MKAALFLSLALTAVSTTSAAPTEDLVLSLPGWEGPLPSKWFSGFLTYKVLDKNINTHYIYIEQEKRDEVNSSTNSTDGPLIFWSNGGPGASSLFGLFTELGPLQLNDDSLASPEYLETGTPTLYKNDAAWSNVGDLLIFDAPAPVGFSYCDNDWTGDGLSCGDWNDELASANNKGALDAFYLKFPELKAKDLYLTGESYAGIYVPTFAREILDDSASGINLKGFAVGDACTGTEVLCGGDNDFGPYMDLMFMYGHGQFSSKTWESIVDSCTIQGLKHIPEGGYSLECKSPTKPN